ncbi:MAG: plasmid recombination protein [Ruminococcus sp.]
MKEKRISFCQGKGSLTHNNRLFIADNVDSSRMRNNITFIRKDISCVYEHLFAESTRRYNARQKRNDRKIHGTYYESLFHQKPSNSVVTATDKRKSFYEDVVQIGKKEDSGVGTEDAQLVADCLKAYMAGYQQRNPNFVVFNAVLHMDEATPHLHIDYVPVGHYKRGQDTQNGIAQALKEMGFGEGKGAIARWRASEVEVLNRICLAHGIKPLEPEKSRGSMSVKEYKAARQEADRLETENIQLKSENENISRELAETKVMLEKANKKKVQLVDIGKIEVKPTIFGNKVTVDKDDYDKLHALAEKEVVSVKQTRKLSAENKRLSEENEALKSTVDQQAAELAEYRKPATMSVKTLIKGAKEISEKERLASDLQKARSFIAANGLSEEFRRYRPNTKNHELE